VEAVADPGGLWRLQGEWERLAAACGPGHPFLNPGWFRAWWECFGAGARARVLVVREGEEVVAIAPLRERRTRFHGVPARVIGSMHNDHTPRFDLLVGRREEEAYDAIWDHLAAARSSWDVLEFAPLVATSRTLAALAARAERDGCGVGIWRGAPAPWVALGDGWEALLRRLSHNRRAQMRKHRRRLERAGEVTLEVIDGGPGLDEALEEGLRMEADGWKRAAGTAILCRDEVARFYRRLATTTAGDGSLRLFFLRSAGVRIAFAYALLHADRLFVLKSGYRRDRAAHSPYQVLTAMILEDACARGLVEYDFLGGSEAWKLHWTKDARAHDWLYVFGDSGRARLIRAVKFGLLPRLRRILPR
jgi:CelD/BcsL family acetyltransferase involved in cellulose biosynthesis